MESELINKSDRKFNNELKTENVSFWYTASSSEAFGRVFNRKLSSLKCPTLDRPAADMNRKVEYMVEISCIFIRLGEIDNTRETFFAEAFLQAKWNDKHLYSDSYNPSKDWNPEIIIEVNNFAFDQFMITT